MVDIQKLMAKTFVNHWFSLSKARPVLIGIKRQTDLWGYKAPAMTLRSLNQLLCDRKPNDSTVSKILHRFFTLLV